MFPPSSYPPAIIRPALSLLIHRRYSYFFIRDGRNRINQPLSFTLLLPYLLAFDWMEGLASLHIQRVSVYGLQHRASGGFTGFRHHSPASRTLVLYYAGVLLFRVTPTPFTYYPHQWNCVGFPSRVFSPKSKERSGIMVWFRKHFSKGLCELATQPTIQNRGIMVS